MHVNISGDGDVTWLSGYLIFDLVAPGANYLLLVSAGFGVGGAVKQRVTITIYVRCYTCLSLAQQQL